MSRLPLLKKGYLLDKVHHLNPQGIHNKSNRVKNKAVIWPQQILMPLAPNLWKLMGQGICTKTDIQIMLKKQFPKLQSKNKCSLKKVTNKTDVKVNYVKLWYGQWELRQTLTGFQISMRNNQTPYTVLHSYNGRIQTQDTYNGKPTVYTWKMLQLVSAVVV